MRRLKICQDGCAGVTVVSNRFIDEFMPQANDAQLKIYLYLLRAVSAGLPLDISEIADAFNHTEKDVMRALKYWEKRGVLLMECDTDGNLSGLRLCDLSGLRLCDLSALRPRSRRMRMPRRRPPLRILPFRLPQLPTAPGHPGRISSHPIPWTS